MPEMLVRLKRGKTTFEVLTYEGSVTKYREKTLKSLDDVLVSGDDVFTDVKKGQKASREQLTSAFETDNSREVLETILQKGEVQVGASERQAKLEQKRAEIMTYIHKHYVEPGKGNAIPLTRIESALEVLRPRIDVDRSADSQVAAFEKKLTEIMPMRKGHTSVWGVVSVPTQYIGAASGVVRKHATVSDEEFGDRVRWTVEVHSFDALVRDLARATKGDYEFTAAGDTKSTSGGAPAPAQKAAGGKKKKGRGKK